MGEEELKASMERLADSIDNLFNLFKSTAETLKIEQTDTQTVDEKINPLTDRLNQLQEQNEKIAKGIVTLADMVEELKKQRVTPPPAFNPRPQPPAQPTPQMPSNPPEGPPPSQPLPQMPAPPGPPKDEKKKGFFHF